MGLMGVVSDAALAAGGRVIGVIPQALADREVAHEGLSEMYILDTMHERKAKMSDLSDAFIALPGGYGTFDELFEVVTWAQLGIQQKPIGLLNVDGYYDSLLQLIERGVQEDFIPHSNRGLIRDAASVGDLLRKIEC